MVSAKNKSPVFH